MAYMRSDGIFKPLSTRFDNCGATLDTNMLILNNHRVNYHDNNKTLDTRVNDAYTVIIETAKQGERQCTTKTTS